MAIPSPLIDDIRDRADIVNIISEYVPLKKRGSNFVGLCPFHQEKTPSFSVNVGKNIWHCFGCGEGGNVYTFLSKINNWSFIEAVKSVADRVGVALPVSDEEKKQADQFGPLYRQAERECQLYEAALRSDEAAVARQYLALRHVSEEIVTRFRLGFAPSGRFSKRLIFPIFDIKGQCVAFGGRQLSDDKKIAKYINSSESPIYVKGNHLYGLHVAKPFIQKQDLAILVEGYMDAIACHQAGLTHVAAILGTALTMNQARLIKRLTSHIVLAFDADEAGQKAAARSLEMIQGLDIDVKVAHLPLKDPDETISTRGVHVLEHAIATAVPRLRFLIDRQIADRPAESPEEKSAIVSACQQILQHENPILQEEYWKYIAQQLYIDTHTLQKLGKSVFIPVTRRAGRAQTPSPKSTKTAAALLYHAMHDVSLRETLFTHFTPEDFLEEEFICLARALKETSLVSPELFDHLESAALRNTATKLAFMEGLSDFETYLNAFRVVKKDRLQTEIKERIRVAESKKDTTLVSHLQEEYAILKKA